MSLSTPRLAGFIPAYNAAATVGEAVNALRLQQLSTPLAVLVIDDASTDDTSAKARAAGAAVETMPVNSGRGAVRNRAIELLHEADFIVSLDAGNRVPEDFVANALPLLTDPTVGAVVGHWWTPAPPHDFTSRWRARHLFRIERQVSTGQPCYLSTHGCILRREAVISSGGFPPHLRHTEDAVLGWRMHQAGWKILSCADARVEPLTRDSISSLAQRYWRWHAGTRESMTFSRYINSIRNAGTVMLPLDWQARDWTAGIFTLGLPHWLALYTLWRRWTGRVQK